MNTHTTVVVTSRPSMCMSIIGKVCLGTWLFFMHTLIPAIAAPTAADTVKNKILNDVLPYSGYFHVAGNKSFIQVPNDYDQEGQYPLIIFLHGNGADGVATKVNVVRHPYDLFRKRIKERGYILAAPLYGTDSWMNPSGEMIVLGLIEFLEKNLSIDKAKIYIMGKSMGGGSALTFATLHPKRIAAVCDLNGVTDYTRFYREGHYCSSLSGAFGGGPDEKAEVYRERSSLYNTDKLKDVPIMIIHGDKDHAVSISYSETLYNKLRKKKRTVEFIEVPGVGHENSIINGLEDRILDFFEAFPRN